MTKFSLDELTIPTPPYRMTRPVASLAAQGQEFKNDAIAQALGALEMPARQEASEESPEKSEREKGLDVLAAADAVRRPDLVDKSPKVAQADRELVDAKDFAAKMIDALPDAPLATPEVVIPPPAEVSVPPQKPKLTISPLKDSPPVSAPSVSPEVTPAQTNAVAESVAQPLQPEAAQKSAPKTKIERLEAERERILSMKGRLDSISYERRLSENEKLLGDARAAAQRRAETSREGSLQLPEDATAQDRLDAIRAKQAQLRKAGDSVGADAWNKAAAEYERYIQGAIPTPDVSVPSVLEDLVGSDSKSEQVRLPPNRQLRDEIREGLGYPKQPEQVPVPPASAELEPSVKLDALLDEQDRLLTERGGKYDTISRERRLAENKKEIEEELARMNAPQETPAETAPAETAPAETAPAPLEPVALNPRDAAAERAKTVTDARKAEREEAARKRAAREDAESARAFVEEQRMESDENVAREADSEEAAQREIKDDLPINLEPRVEAPADLPMRPREEAPATPDASVTPESPAPAPDTIENPDRRIEELRRSRRENAGVGILSGAVEWASRKTNADVGLSWLGTLIPRIKSVWHRQFAENRARQQEKTLGGLEYAKEKRNEHTEKMNDTGWPLKKFYAWRSRVWEKRVVKREGLVNKYDVFRMKRIERHNELQKQVSARYERELAPFRAQQEALKRSESHVQKVLETLNATREKAVAELTAAEAKRKGIFGKGGAAAARIRREVIEIEGLLKKHRKELMKIQKPLASATARVDKYTTKQKQIEATLKFPEMEGLRGIPRSGETTLPRRRSLPMNTSESSQDASRESARESVGERDGEEWSASEFVEQWNNNGLNHIEDADAFNEYVKSQREAGDETGPITLGRMLALSESYLKANRQSKDFSKNKNYFLRRVPKPITERT